MRRFILFLALFLSVALSSQAQDSFSIQKPDSVVTSTISIDSLAKKQSMDLMSENLNRFMLEQKKRDSKAKRDAMIRIGIGIFFLVVLVFGLMRRKKKKE